ncbi:hypothetical protein GCM10012289_52220 [Nonomuraea cavernae]|uniref:Uncharacterized protein n=1 Tax=Nonomuraea cavernae TaxID=2045107 RepID=A0A918DP74_9ACTN|nr:hypothetical protein GCM10012289_52220 [Nonomuraea cavernae]
MDGLIKVVIIRSRTLLAFAADAGTFTTLGSQHVGVAGVGVTPAQVGLQLTGQDGVIGMVGAALAAPGDAPQGVIAE